MKKIFCFLITLCMAINVFALRLGIASVEWYFEQEIIGKENDCTLLLFGPNEDDFNSSWHLSLKSDDSDFIHYRKDWRICSKEKLQTYVNQEAAKGNVVIHYKNNLYYVGVNEKLRGKVPVETFLNNFFEGKTFITEEHQIGDIKMFFAFIPEKENEKIFNRAVLFENDDGKIIRRLCFYSCEINNIYPYMRLIYGFNEDGEFSGYEAKFSEDGNSLTVVPYFDDGTVVGEGILLEWKAGQFFSPQR